MPQKSHATSTGANSHRGGWRSVQPTMIMTVPLRKAEWRSARVRHAHNRRQSVQMATLSRRHYYVVCALVSPLPHLCGTDGGDGQGKRFGHQPQLCVALGADLRTGVGQALPAASETNQSELEGG